MLIDGLHISRIDIRDENSLDLKPFIYHKVSAFTFAMHLEKDRELTSACFRRGKTIKQHIVKMTEDVDRVKDLLAKLMDVRESSVLLIRPSSLG
jgi:ATP-dependent DNA helicase MPH1